jgi:iron complex outermembrane receptor protein
MRGVGTCTNNAYLDAAITISYDGVFGSQRGGRHPPPSTTSSGSRCWKGRRASSLRRKCHRWRDQRTAGQAAARPGERLRLLAVGSYEERQVEGALNLPLWGQSALRFAFNRYKHEGYNKDGTNDADVAGARLQYLIEPSERVTFKIGADYTKIGGFGNGWSYAGVYTPGSYTFVPSGLPVNEGTATPAANAYRRTILGAPGFGFLNDLQDEYYQDYWYTGVNAELNVRTDYWHLDLHPGLAQVRWLRAASVARVQYRLDQDAHKQTSAELRLTSTGDRRLDYIAGAYYFDETSDSNNTYNQEFVLPLQIYTHETRSLAGFGQLTFHATDRLRLVGGAATPATRRTWTASSTTSSSSVAARRRPTWRRRLRSVVAAPCRATCRTSRRWTRLSRRSTGWWAMAGSTRAPS